MHILDRIRSYDGVDVVLRCENGGRNGVILNSDPGGFTLYLYINTDPKIQYNHLIRIEDMSRIVHEFRWDESRKGNIASGLMIEHDHGTVIGENGDILRTIRKYIN